MIGVLAKPAVQKTIEQQFVRSGTEFEPNQELLYLVCIIPFSSNTNHHYFNEA